MHHSYLTLHASVLNHCYVQIMLILFLENESTLRLNGSRLCSPQRTFLKGRPPKHCSIDSCLMEDITSQSGFPLWLPGGCRSPFCFFSGCCFAPLAFQMDLASPFSFSVNDAAPFELPPLAS